MISIRERLKNVFSVFRGRDPTSYTPTTYNNYYASTASQNRPRFNPRISRSNLVSIYNKIAIDVSSVPINHVRLDDEGKYSETIKGPLNDVLTLDANLDQTGRELIRDAVMTMLNDGSCAIVPIYTNGDPYKTDSFTVEEARVGSIVQFMPYHVKVNVYNIEHGRREDVIVPKSQCVLLENPFYAVMNEPNATGMRLINTLNQIDEQNSEAARGKFNLIIQSPFAARSKKNQELSKIRRQEIEDQLTNSPHGIAYIDASDHVIQLNRALENDLWQQAQDLQAELLNQIGVAKEVFDGTADEHQQMNYFDRVVTPILKIIIEGIERKWLSKTARSQGQAIRYFRDPFSSVPLSNIADIFDKMKKNEIMSSNECRSVLGLKPVDNERANELVNAAINVKEDVEEKKEVVNEEEEIQNE